MAAATTTRNPCHYSFLKSSSTAFTRRRTHNWNLQKHGGGRSSIKAELRKEDVVIVGGGISGLATALSLHRLGVRSMVVEQAESLRTGGTSLTLSKNGWSVLDAIGIGDLLRPHFLEIQGLDFKSPDGNQIRSFNFKDEGLSQELRGVERRVLLETLAGQLPPDVIQYSSKLARIEATSNGDNLLELGDGSKLLAKIVIGCDGIRSPIAKWMGFSEPRYVGHCAIRGLASYSDGHPYEQRVSYIYGRGVRTGFVPITPTKVYWFFCFNSPTPGPRITDTLELKKQAKELVRNWSSELLNAVDSSPDDTVSRTPLVDRWNWPGISPPASRGRVVLVGDAWHPMTPNLGQGACTALEDAVVLSKKLARAINSGGENSVEEALRSYEAERWPRVLPMTIRAYLVGSVLQSENPLLCSVRNSVVMPNIKLGPMLEHTNYTVESL